MTVSQWWPVQTLAYLSFSNLIYYWIMTDGTSAGFIPDQALHTYNKSCWSRRVDQVIFVTYLWLTTSAVELVIVMHVFLFVGVVCRLFWYEDNLHIVWSFHAEQTRQRIVHNCNIYISTVYFIHFSQMLQLHCHDTSSVVVVCDASLWLKLGLRGFHWKLQFNASTVWR